MRQMQRLNLAAIPDEKDDLFCFVAKPVLFALRRSEMDFDQYELVDPSVVNFNEMEGLPGDYPGVLWIWMAKKGYAKSLTRGPLWR